MPEVKHRSLEARANAAWEKNHPNQPVGWDQEWPHVKAMYRLAVMHEDEECPVCGARRFESCMDTTGPLGYVPYTGRHRWHDGRREYIYARDQDAAFPERVRDLKTLILGPPSSS